MAAMSEVFRDRWRLRKQPAAESDQRRATSALGASQTGLFLGELHLCRASFRFTRHWQDNTVGFGYRSDPSKNLTVDDSVSH